MFCRTTAAWLLLLLLVSLAPAETLQPAVEPLVRVVDLDLGETCKVKLCNGKTVTVKLLDLNETSDSVRNAVRKAVVEVEIDGRQTTLTSANYELPKTIGGVQVDCPVTKGYVRNSKSNAWALDKDARLRFWPAGSPLLRPNTFVYPVKQRWFAAATQMANEPCYVDAGERPNVRSIYYHYGLDFGGAEGMVEVVSATDGLVVSARTERLAGHEDTPVSPRYDVVYILDNRGWYYRYSHFESIDEAIRPGKKVRAGERLGLLGKEGGSGGWTHLHFDISCRQPPRAKGQAGKWGSQEAYAFAWEAYRKQYNPKLIAVARPHHLIWAGEKVTLDATRSFSAEGKIAQYDWSFTDGTTAHGSRVERTYAKPGYYSEILKVTDAAGRVDYDFAIVDVLNRRQPDLFPPTIHPVYWPTFGIQPGDPVTFKVRTFATTDGEETWDFGDGSPTQQSKSDGNANVHAKDGYAVVTHRYRKPGHYLVRVERTDRHGHRATAYVQVRIGDDNR